MNKQFNEEYKQYADRQTPDLWSRIEGALDARIANDVIIIKEENTPVIPDESRIVSMAEAETKKKSKRNGKRFDRLSLALMRYGSIAAAVVVLGIVILAIGLNRTNEKLDAIGGAEKSLMDTSVKAVSEMNMKDSLLEADLVAEEDGMNPSQSSYDDAVKQPVTTAEKTESSIQPAEYEKTESLTQATICDEGEGLTKAEADEETIELFGTLTIATVYTEMILECVLETMDGKLYRGLIEADPEDPSQEFLSGVNGGERFDNVRILDTGSANPDYCLFIWKVVP